MGLEVEAGKFVLEGVSLLGTLLVGWIGLKTKGVATEIKLDQAKNKADLVAEQTRAKSELVASQTEIKEKLVRAQTEMKQEFTAHNAAMRTEFSVHTASDDQRFGEQGRTLDRIEKKIDRNYSARHSGDAGK